MSNLVINPSTNTQIDNFLQSPAHAVMLVGPVGSGKFSLAKSLAASVIDVHTDKIDTYQYAKFISPDGAKGIGIDSIRALEHFLSLKVPGAASFNRVVIIENAHQMGQEAQNALLKTLEEPAEGTIVILTAASDKSILPTILSRVQRIRVQKPSKGALSEHFGSQSTDVKQLDKALTLSAGLPGLLQALLSEDEHPLLEATEVARQIVSQPTYQRLLVVDSLAKNRELAVHVTYILQQMARVSLQSASGANAKKWQSVLQAAYDASESLAGSGQIKLVLTNLMLQI